MEILSNAPWWIYALACILVIFGLIATRRRTISLYRLYFLPTLFTIWNLVWLLGLLKGHYSLMLLWVVGIGLGVLIGYRTVHHWKVKADHKKTQIILPGSYSTLVIILSAFLLRYYFLYQHKFHPEMVKNILSSEALFSGIITGIFVGRSFDLFLKYRNG